MIAFDRQEALRYLGYRNTEPDTAVADSLAPFLLRLVLE